MEFDATCSGRGADCGTVLKVFGVFCMGFQACGYRRRVFRCLGPHVTIGLACGMLNSVLESYMPIIFLGEALPFKFFH